MSERCVQKRCQRHFDTVARAERRKAMSEERLKKTDPFGRPRGARPKTPQKLCHAESFEAYKEYRDMYRELKRAHMQASGYYRSGIFDVDFPPGTFKPPIVAAA